MKIDLGPVTRLEGHLNISTTVEDHVIVDARCMGEMFRGFEAFLRGRDPLDAQQITQRICGVCPYAHAIASSYAQEAAYKLAVPANGRILHNLIQGANHLYDYLLHFYQLSALDFIDVTAVVQYQGSDPDLVKLRTWVKAELESGKTYPAAPFLPRLTGRYIEDAEINIGALKHYLEAMEIQKKANQASALFGGKFPHSTSIFPGGCTRQPEVDLLAAYQSLIGEVRTFVQQKYLPDLLAVARAFPEYWEIGASKGGFLSFGLMPLGSQVGGDQVFAPGLLVEGRVQPVDYDKITEDVLYAKYSTASGLPVRRGGLKPELKKPGAYSWIKAPRYDGQMVEVGPAARVLVEYQQGRNQAVRGLVDRLMGEAGINPAKLNSVLGRHLARGICALVIADFLLAEADRALPGEPAMAEIVIPREGEGFGGTEASRGALLHYIRIKDHKIDQYECVVPTTWNCSPRDDRGRAGALESALIGCRVENPDQQIEALRVVHSFDPCLACAVH